MAGVPLLAQQTPSGAAQDQDQAVETLKVQVDVVNLFFNVKDKHGLLIPHLTKSDFQVLEDGGPQTIKFFSADTDQPLTLGILIDSSGSQTNVLPMEKEVGGTFLAEVIRTKDEAFVIGFDVNVDLLHDFTNSVSELRRAMNRAQINIGGGGGLGPPGLGGGPIPNNNPRGTLLYDAVYLAATDKLSHEVGRKAMILLTDGEDQGSRLKIQDAIEAAQKADAMCYVILVADRGFYGGFYRGDREMRKLAEETGGRVIDVGNKFDKLKQAFAEISAELRSQYSIGYTPSNTARDGGFRRVEIHPAQKDLKVQARLGYYAPGEGAPPDSSGKKKKK